MSACSHVVTRKNFKCFLIGLYLYSFIFQLVGVGIIKYLDYICSHVVTRKNFKCFLIGLYLYSFIFQLVGVGIIKYLDCAITF